MTIILSTLNARYIHTALGLRYLKANMGPLEEQTSIMEFDLHRRPIDIAEILLQENPTIIGFGVYIWNIEQTTQLVAILKQIKPSLIIVAGGPEVSYEYDTQKITVLVDYLITGAADHAFSQLCQQILQQIYPTTKIIAAVAPKPLDIKSPYYLYDQRDIAHRIIYVEASRGCPFKCEFCLSALDKTSTPFDLDAFLKELDKLFQRGARHFKFVDRTFNLNIENSCRILSFFLDRIKYDVFVHFEVIPDQIPEKLKSLIKKFPDGSLQFEVGIQSFDPVTQNLINRKQNNNKTKENLLWLRQQTKAHLHTDLILGLPGETLESIANGFDELVRLEPQEIQVGILKRLRGTPIARHSNKYSMVYNPNPPYNLMSSNTLDFHTMQQLSRFARYWDLVANSGRFRKTLPFILGHNPFMQFLQFSNWLYHNVGQTHKISLQRLFNFIHTFLISELSLNESSASSALLQDHLCSGLKSCPSFIDKKQYSIIKKQFFKASSSATTGVRQSRHM